MNCRIVKKLSAAAMAAVAVTAGMAFAQDANTAYVPFVVNVDATVTASQEGAEPVSMTVTGGEQKTLAVPLGGTDAVRYNGAAQGRNNAPIVTGSRGNITLRLPAQSYANAEIALYSVSGKRILRGKAAASEASSAISRRNVAAGVYMLSVKGIDGNAVTTRLTHNGGNMNISVAFGVENVSPKQRLAKSAAAGEWKITVSAVETGYKDSTYTLNLAVGQNPTQNITLIAENGGGGDDTFVDERDNTTYKKVTIGEQTWMAENLNYDVPDNTSNDDVCYNNSADSCAKYGRLYNWATAMGGASSSSAVPSGVQGVCPVGWHLPSDGEWTALTTFVGTNAGTKLKSTSGWNNGGNGADDFGFSALPGGYGGSDGSFDNAGYSGDWWSATEGGAGSAWGRRMFYGSEIVSRGYGVKTGLFSVRCVQD